MNTLLDIGKHFESDVDHECLTFNDLIFVVVLVDHDAILGGDLDGFDEFFESVLDIDHDLHDLFLVTWIGPL